MASPGNQQCPNCIGTLSFLMAHIRSSVSIFDILRRILFSPPGCCAAAGPAGYMFCCCF